MKKNIKGYNLSKDYNKLWELIHDGYYIPVWLYPDGESYGWLKIAEARLVDGEVVISTPGVGYTGYKESLEDFIKTCEEYSISFIIPDFPCEVKIKKPKDEIIDPT